MTIARPCVVCGELIAEGSYCAAHAPKHSGPGKSRNDAVYQTTTWRKISRRLRKIQPWCNQCGATEDLQVDHIEPLSRGGAPYDIDNLQILCRACNVAKSNRHPGGSPLPHRGKVAADEAKSRSHTGMIPGKGVVDRESRPEGDA